MNQLEQHEKTKYVSFMVSNERYCIQILCLKEVLDSIDLEVVPGSAVGVHGVINLRGEILSVIDGSYLMCGKQGVLDSGSKALIVHDPITDIKVAVVVDRVYEVYNVEANDVETVDNSMVGKIAVHGLYQKQGYVWALIDENKLFETTKL